MSDSTPGRVPTPDCDRSAVCIAHQHEASCRSQMSWADQEADARVPRDGSSWTCVCGYGVIGPICTHCGGTFPDAIAAGRVPSGVGGVTEWSLAVPDTRAVPVVNLRCCGCGWRAAASTLALLNAAARRHDDSPSTQHIVTLDPPQRWPESDDEFQAVPAAPARTPS